MAMHMQPVVVPVKPAPAQPGTPGTPAPPPVRPKEKEVRDVDRRINAGEIVTKRWQIVRVIGEGGFGAVYEVRDVNAKASTDTYAMKVEANKAPITEQVLKMDVNILRRIQGKKSKHFVSLIDVGKDDRVHFMVTSLVGMNLHDLKKPRRGKFSFRTIAHIAISSLEAVRELHDIGYLHRDIKPANLAIGRPPKSRDLYLLDFGLCRQYKHENGRLRRPRDRAGFRGTMRYAPVACHRNQETSRADDLWNWLYVVIELTAGRLPWDHEITKTRQLPLKEAIKRVGRMKEVLNGNPTTLMDRCPIEFMTVHQHITTLNFQSDPDYSLMTTALKKMEERRRQPDKDGDKLDWEKPEPPPTAKKEKKEANAPVQRAGS